MELIPPIKRLPLVWPALIAVKKRDERIENEYTPA
jgi:hypothetical protein